MELPGLPNGDIKSEEDSAGVYRLRAPHPSGYSIDLKGTKIIKLVQQLEERDERLGGS